MVKHRKFVPRPNIPGSIMKALPARGQPACEAAEIAPAQTNQEGVRVSKGKAA